MRIEGFEPGQVSTVVVLRRPGGRDLQLTVTALPIGYDEELERGLPNPVPPVRGPLRDERGSLLREAGRPVPFYDTFDPKYQAERRQAMRRRMTLMIREALRGDSQVQWETPEEKGGRSDADYADALYAEMRAFGFTEGDLAALIGAVVQASSLTEEELAKGREQFFRPGTPGADPGAPEGT